MIYTECEQYSVLAELWNHSMQSSTQEERDWCY